LNANGMIRGFMACHMKLEPFVAHVVSCVKRQLEEFDPTSMFFMDCHTNFFLFYGQTFGKTFQLIMTFPEAEELKAQSPYALDRYIWQEIEENGIPIQLSTHYLQTVFMGEK
jgi:hypothetical protein